MILRKIISISVPIIIGCEIMPIMTLIDTGIIMTRLQATGWSYAEAKSLYGLLSGFCNSLIAFPQVFTQAVAVSLVPAIAAAFKLRDKKNVQENIKLGYRTTMIMAFPCAFGIFALAEPILLLLYPAQKASAIAAVPTLMIMAISVIFLAITQTSVGVLQSIGKQMVPVVHLGLGCVGKSDHNLHSGRCALCQYQGRGHRHHAGLLCSSGIKQYFRKEIHWNEK